MAETNIVTQKDFEKEYKENLFSRIEHLCSSQSELLSHIKKSEEHLNLDVANELPNIGITFNNKIVELLHTFQDAGLSMFSENYENFGPKNINFISSSFIGDSIIFYMLDEVDKSVKSLVKYKSKLASLINLEREKCNAFYSANPIKKFSLMARSLVALPPELDFSCTMEDIFELNGYALTCIALDNDLWDCTLQDIIVPCLVAHVKRTKFDKQTIIEFFDSSLIPSLEKLGLSDTIPKLRQEIEKAYEDSKEQSSDEDAR